MKTKYVFALGALLTCLLVRSAAQAEPFESKAIDSRSVSHENVVPVFTLPTGAIVSPSGELVGFQPRTNLVPVMGACNVAFLCVVYQRRFIVWLGSASVG